METLSVLSCTCVCRDRFGQQLCHPFPHQRNTPTTLTHLVAFWHALLAVVFATRRLSLLSRAGLPHRHRLQATRLRTELTSEEVAEDFRVLDGVSKLIATSDSDHLSPPSEMFELVKQKSSHCETGVILESGHYSLEEQPAQVVQQIMTMLRKAGLT